MNRRLLSILLLSTVPLIAYGQSQRRESRQLVNEQLIQLEMEWSRADIRQDVVAIKRLVAVDWIGTTSRGKIVNRSEMLDEVVILDAIRKALATPPRHYVPIVFDFDKPDDRTLIGSILRFASVSRFVIADLSDPKSVPAELQAIVPQFVSLPVMPIIEATQREYPVADDILSRQSVKPVVAYRDEAHLMAILDAQILAPAEELYAELNPRAVG